MKNSVFFAAITGFFVAAFFCSQRQISPDEILFALCITAVGVILCIKRTDRRAIVIFACAGIAAGLLWSVVYNAVAVRPALKYAEQSATLSVLLIEQPVTDARYASAVGEASAGSVFSPRVKIQFYYDTTLYTLRPGDRFDLTATWRDAGGRSAHYPQSGIILLAEDIEITDFFRPERIPLRCVPAYVSGLVQQKILSLFDAETAGFINALTMGNRAGLSDATQSDFLNSGLSHIVSVSGMHFAFLAGLFLLLLPRRAAPFVVLPVVWFFAGMVGFVPSVTRSVIMLTIALIAPLLRRDASPVNSLFFALFLILLVNPNNAGSVSLILSFLSTLGILTLTPRMQTFAQNRLPPGVYKVLRPILLSLFVSISAMLYSLPVLAIYFDSLSLVSPLANIVSLWAVEGCFLLGLASVAISFVFPPLAALTASVVSVLARYVADCAGFFSSLKFSTLGLPGIYPVACLLAIYILGFVLFRFRKARKVAVVSTLLIVGMISSAVIVSAQGLNSKQLRVTVLDVGQGQCVLAGFQNKTYLFDCGTSYHISAGDTAANHLRAQNIRRIDVLVLSHFDADHYNGIDRLLQGIEIGIAYVPDDEKGGEVITRLLSAGVDVRAVEGFAEYADQIEINMLSRRSWVSKEIMMISRFSYDGFDMLLTGDADSEQETYYAYTYGLPPKETDVLIVGHHGSDTSTSPYFIAETLPRNAVISVGRSNAFGHPSDETLKTLAQYKADVYRTDLDGDVTILYDNKKMTITTEYQRD